MTSMPKTISGVGFNVHLHYYDAVARATMLDALVALGARWIRLEIDIFSYSNATQVNGLRQFCQACNQHNIVVVGLLYRFTPLTLRSVFFPETQYPPIFRQLRQLEQRIPLLVNLLKSEVGHWEIWNEQNTSRFWSGRPNALEYMQFLRSIKQMIFASDPEAVIVYGGLSCIANQVSSQSVLTDYRRFLSDSLDSGAADEVDLFSFHPYTLQCYLSLYPNPRSVTDGIKRKIEEIWRQFGQLPSLITEIGVSPILNLGLTSKVIAKMYVELEMHCEQENIPVAFYVLADPQPTHYGLINPDRSFGFLDHDLRPKPLYWEYLRLKNGS